MKKHSIWRKIRLALSALHLADKCLLVFMIILLFQSAYVLFFRGVVAQGNDTLDVVIRTTTAAIFGYFISANFQNGGKRDPENDLNDNSTIANTPTLSPTHSQPMARIGFSANSEKQELHAEKPPRTCKNRPECRNRLQIIVVASIGIFALFMLVIARNYIPTTAVSVATISQLRDFVSGSVGFLIGHSTHQK